MNGERGRPARGVWRPAKHIFVPYPRRTATFCASSLQRTIAENRGGVRRVTHRTTTGTVALPNSPDWLDSSLSKSVKTIQLGFDRVLPHRKYL